MNYTDMCIITYYWGYQDALRLLCITLLSLYTAED
jgi:hypothetical protein